LKEDIVLQHKEWTTRRGKQEMWNIGLKGQITMKTMWYKRNHIERKFPHLSWEYFGDQNPPNGEV
jgi:hypothetical protein